MQFTLQTKHSNLAEALIVPVAQPTGLDNVLPQISEKTGISPEVIKADFKAGLKDIHTLYFTENEQVKRIILLGLGENPRSSDVINAFRFLVFKRKDNLSANLAVSFLHGNAPENQAAWVEAAANGMLLGGYDIGLYKTEKKNNPAPQSNAPDVAFFVEEKYADAAATALQKGRATAETQLEIFNIVNAPANKKTPQTLAEWALQSGEKFGYEVRVFNKDEIMHLGLHALLAVSQGSDVAPTFIVMDYQPKDQKPIKKIGLVGKGVTFDTGGLSIKPSTNMHYMKSDMGGAAAVLGAMELAAKLKVPFHLTGIIPATENSVDAKSTRPGDVIGSYQGKTIEVIDTDAEGRLILADGLTYAVRRFKPDILIDLATLTGSCIRTLGTYAGGLFSNNDDLANQLRQAGEKTGERLWQLPLWDEYRKELKSDIADIKNFSGSPAAGAITAAKFLEAFIEDHPAWAHMDIAGMAIADSEFSAQKSATGFGIRLLIEFLDDLAARHTA